MAKATRFAVLYGGSPAQVEARWLVTEVERLNKEVRRLKNELAEERRANTRVEYRNGCHSCGGWGAPLGCRCCGITCMGG